MSGPIASSGTEAPHPHGVLGYTLADRERTGNAIRLARWVVVAMAILAAAMVTLAVTSPCAAAALLGTGSTATLSRVTARWRRNRRRSTLAREARRDSRSG